MPYKFNDARRHKFEKKKYRITNWPAYNESLRQRGDVTIWLSDEVEVSVLIKQFFESTFDQL